MLIIFRRLLNKSFHLLRSHLLAFLYLLDPIEDGPINREPGRLNGHFGLAFLTFVAIFLESTILLATSNFNYSNATLVYHKLYLRSFWKYTDVIFACSMFLTIFVFGNLTFNWKMAEKYRIGVNRETGRLVSNQIGTSPNLPLPVSLSPHSLNDRYLIHFFSAKNGIILWAPESWLFAVRHATF